MEENQIQQNQTPRNRTQQNHIQHNRIQQDLIPKIADNNLETQLKNISFLRKTNRNNKDIYSTTFPQSPSLVREIGRLRELTFRAAGGGTGKSVDLDSYDLDPDHPYNQLFVFDKLKNELVGAYRYHLGSKNFPLDENNNPKFATSKLFNFSEKFIEDYLPTTIELGRSFITPENQIGRLGLFSLANLWDGLGTLMKIHPEQEYFLGKVTIYSGYDSLALDLLQSYFSHCCKLEDSDLIVPKHEFNYERNVNLENEDLFWGKNQEEGYVILHKEMRKIGVPIPPLINTYLKTSPSLQTFGTAHNYSFGDVLETGIIIKIKDIYESKWENHVRYDDK